MRCEVVRMHCRDYLESRLPVNEEAAFREHILHCPDCRAEVVRQDPSILFSVLGEERKPEAFWIGFWEQIEDRLPRRNAWADFFFRFEPALAVAAVLLMVAGIVLFMPRENSRLHVFTPPVVQVEQDLTLAVVETLYQRYSLSSYLASCKPGAEVIEMSFNGEEDEVYQITMILDEGMEETF